MCLFLFIFKEIKFIIGSRPLQMRSACRSRKPSGLYAAQVAGETVVVAGDDGRHPASLLMTGKEL